MSEATGTTACQLSMCPGPLDEGEIQDYVGRCPEETRWAFEGWLRGERHLDGDLIERGDESRSEDDGNRGRS
ncbi:hypothetical protein F1D05_36305 [Kribbella qitaiheensis]|uniref:Uncharacterized protein n=1 Tax=Kribbella qitaiheensis TaxID=1544730 RepID=A0A7G6X801_9ACTN|nr:hypothetical protein F1D05_36305 [Kribbella qitaiheensis]